MTLPEATTDIVLRLLTFEEYDAGVQFLETMRGVVKDLRPDLHAPVTKAASATRFAEELRKPADLVIVSAHGPAYKIGKPFEPGLCASTDGLHWLSLQEICPGAGDSIGIRAGIVWDACNAGRPGFRDELEPLLAYEIANIGVIGQIGNPDSTNITTKILQSLLAPGSPRITAETVQAAGMAAKPVTRLQLSSELLGGKEAP